MYPIKQLSFRMTAGLLLSVAFAGCGSGGSTPGTISPARNVVTTSVSQEVSISGGGALQFTLDVGSNSYGRGVPIPIKLIMKNTGSVSVPYGTAVLLSDAIVQDASGATVWQYSRSIAGIGAGGALTSLATGQSVTSNMTWDQTQQGPGFEPGFPGPYAPPGQYTVMAWWDPASLGLQLTTAQAQAQLSPPPVSVVIQDGTAPPQQQPVPPAAPTNLGAIVGSSGIGLGWTPGSGDTSYNIYRRTAGMTYGAPIATQVGGPTDIITDGTPGVTYFFEVRGVAVGNVVGPPSNEVSAVAPIVSHIPPGAPGTPDGPIIGGP